MTPSTRLLSALALGAMVTTAAMAQARPAITQDRDQAGRNYYYAQSSCNQNTFQYCSISFAAPPAGKRLIITQVSILNILNTAAVSSVDLRYLNGSIIAFLKPVLNPATSPTFNYTVNETVFAKFDPGEQPQLLTFVNNNNNFTMVGIISGYMIDIP